MKIAVVGASAIAEGLVEFLNSLDIEVKGFPDQTKISEGDLEFADWVIEASGYAKHRKQAALQALNVKRRPGSILSTDESIVPRSELIEDMPFDDEFYITHFFLPVKKAPLMELVAPGNADLDTCKMLHAFCADRLGRTVLVSPDLPGFIANRVGLYAMARGVQLALALDLDVDQADKAAIDALGLPRSGVFGLVDLIGLKASADLVDDLCLRLPDDDAFQQCNFKSDPAIQALLALSEREPGSLKFYRRKAKDAPREILDVRTFEYRVVRPGQPDEDAAASFGKSLAADVSTYASNFSNDSKLLPEDVSTALLTGYGWSRELKVQSV